MEVAAYKLVSGQLHELLQHGCMSMFDLNFYNKMLLAEFVILYFVPLNFNVYLKFLSWLSCGQHHEFTVRF
jgi:hypothetical protein